MKRNEGMERIRKNLKLVASEQVEVVTGFDGVSGKSRPLFECRGCEVELVWMPALGWLQCPVCTYEMTRPEGLDLLLERVTALSDLALVLEYDLVDEILKAAASSAGMKVIDRLKALVGGGDSHESG